eukprot:8188317-Karenia_brevis.AAC.1
MLDKLASVPQACAMLPFVRLAYAQPSSYAWVGDDGEIQFVEQGEGGEQGDPLMPLLFSLGIHDALARARECLKEDEH